MHVCACVPELHESCVRIMSGWYNLPADKRYPCGGAESNGAPFCPLVPDDKTIVCQDRLGTNV